MPLASLPNELLLDIAGYLGEPELESLNCYYTLVDRRDCLALAATCRTIRRVAVTVLYKHIVLDPNQAWIFTLQKIFTSDQATASSVRHLILTPPENRRLPGWSTPKELLRCYRQILGACTGIQTLLVMTNIATQSIPHPDSAELRLLQCVAGTTRDKGKPKRIHSMEKTPKCQYTTEGKRTNYAYAYWKKPGNSMFRLLCSINLHSRRKINRIEFRNISTYQFWKHIQYLTGFVALETIIATDCHIHDLSPGGAADMFDVCLQSLPSVRTLSIKLQDPYMTLQLDETVREKERVLGKTLASTLPEVRNLTLRAAEDVIYGALNKYVSIGKNLTHLTICPRVSMYGGTHLCDVLSTLSSRLTHLTISKGNETDLCYKLFTGGWGHLKQLSLNDCSFPYSCNGDDSGLEKLRTNILHLLDSKPAAGVMILGQCMWMHPMGCKCDKSLKLVLKESGKKEYFICEEMFDEPSDEESDLEFWPDDYITTTESLEALSVD